MHPGWRAICVFIDRALIKNINSLLFFFALYLDFRDSFGFWFNMYDFAKLSLNGGTKHLAGEVQRKASWGIEVRFQVMHT